MVDSITLPSRTVFTAIHGNLKVRGAQGTVYVFREDNDPLPFNMDEYSFNSDENGKVKLVGPLKPEYHWVPDIPAFIKNQAPQWVKKAVADIDR